MPFLNNPFIKFNNIYVVLVQIIVKYLKKTADFFPTERRNSTRKKKKKRKHKKKKWSGIIKIEPLPIKILVYDI